MPPLSTPAPPVMVAAETAPRAVAGLLFGSAIGVLGWRAEVMVVSFAWVGWPALHQLARSTCR